MKRRLGWIVGAAACGLLTLPGAVQAEHGKVRVRFAAGPGDAREFLVLVADGEKEDRDQAERERWLGIQVSELPPLLRKHLKLDHGVVADAVLPDSPAAKGGIEVDDVLLAIDKQEIDSPEDVRDAIAAAEEDAEVAITLLRDGEKQTVKVTPASRPVALPKFPSTPFHSGGASRQDAFMEAQKAFEKALKHREALGMMFLKPGIVGEGEALALPKDVKVTVTRKGEGPAEIVVERGADRWEVTEKSLDKLPKDLRGPVAAMVQGGEFPYRIPLFPHGKGVRVKPDGTVEGEIRVPDGGRVLLKSRDEEAANPKLDRILKELKELRERMEELERQ